MQMCGQLQNTGRLTSKQRILPLIEHEKFWWYFRVRMPKLPMNFEEIISRANGNFEEQNKIFLVCHSYS